MSGNIDWRTSKIEMLKAGTALYLVTNNYVAKDVIDRVVAMSKAGDAEIDRLRFRLMTAYDLVAESMADTKQYDFEARAASFVRAIQEELKND